MKTSYDVIVIGAGGAGMFCAATAGKLGKSVLIVDHATVIGRKILISGGGRCNFTNLYASADNYVSQNPHFVKSALARYTPGDFIELVERHGIPYHEKKLGQQFCDNSAQNIVDMLIKECDDAGVEFKIGCDVKAIVPPAELPLEVFDNRLLHGVRLSSNNVAEQGRFQVHTSKGSFDCASLVIATGGLSVPKVGATAFGYNVARQFGLKVIDTAPALDGFVFNEMDALRFDDLQGISQEAVVSCGGSSFRENILFTHRGLSGPASLQASLYWKQGAYVEIDLCPDTDIGASLLNERASRSKKNIRNIITEYLPIRLAHRICEDQDVDDSIQHISDKTIEQIADAIKCFTLKPSSTVGYIKAEVTRGGVDTNALSSKTMECKKIPGLFFIGEVVDVTGQLGGFNFQWAWASGYAAGMSV